MRISDWSSDVCSSDLPARWQSSRGPTQRPPRRLLRHMSAGVVPSVVDPQRWGCPSACLVSQEFVDCRVEIFDLLWFEPFAVEEERRGAFDAQGGPVIDVSLHALGHCLDRKSVV